MRKTRANTNPASGAWRLAIVGAVIFLPVLLAACSKKGQGDEEKTVQKNEDDFLDKDVDVSDSCFINNIFNATSFNGIGVLVNRNGQLGTTTSSRRFKEAIKPMDEFSESLFALKPVRFRYKKEIDPSGTSQLGLVAEDLEKVNPDLVVRDKEGKPYSVRYDQVNAILRVAAKNP